MSSEYEGCAVRRAFYLAFGKKKKKPNQTHKKTSDCVIQLLIKRYTANRRTDKRDISINKM